MGPYDPQLVDARFLQRCLHPVPAVARAAKYRESLPEMLDDLRQWQIAAILSVLCLALEVSRAYRAGQLTGRKRWVWCAAAYQMFFWGLYFAIGLVFHPAPRVAHPMISTYLLVNLILFCQVMKLNPWPSNGTRLVGWVRVAMPVLLVLLVLVRSAGVVRNIWKQEQARAIYFARLHTLASGSTLVEGAMYEMEIHLRLFKSYGFGDYRHVVSLRGGGAFDPSQPALYRLLSGSTDPAVTLVHLGRSRQVTWVLYPYYARFLAGYLNLRLGLNTSRHVQFQLLRSALPQEGPQLHRFVENTDTSQLKRF